MLSAFLTAKNHEQHKPVSVCGAHVFYWYTAKRLCTQNFTELMKFHFRSKQINQNIGISKF